MKMNKKSRLAFLAVVGVLLTAPAARADTIPLIDIPNDPTHSWTWNENLMLGYSFTVASSLTFNALAVFDVQSATPGQSPVGTSTNHTNLAGLNASHQVGVWSNSGTLLASATVAPGDPTTSSQNTYGLWVYHLLAAPVTLTSGTYTVGAFYAGNSDPVMVRQSTVLPAPGVTYLNGNFLYTNGFARPTGTFAPNEAQYFGPTLISVPDGGLTLTLLGGALAGLALVRRRRLQ